jgi:2-keto-myo-inositol isomerase
VIPCISQATTLSTRFEDDLAYYASAGFTAVEIWLTKLETYLAGRSLAEVKAAFDREEVKAVAAAGPGGLLLSRGAERETHWAHFRKRLEWLSELEISTLILSPDFVAHPSHDDYQRGAASLAEASALAKAANVRLALEFQKGSGYCSCLETAMALIGASGAENLGVCLDFFHYYTGSSKFEDLAYLTPENLAWVQASDLSGTPREVAGDSDRILPGEGDFQLEPIMGHLRSIGYEGFISLEVLNPSLWEIAGDRVADLGFHAIARTIGLAKPASSRGGT